MAQSDKIDILTFDVPLFIRLLEYAKEDAKTDMDLHNLADNAISLSKEKEILTMDDYNSLVDSSSVKEAIKNVLEAQKKRDRCLRIADRKFDKPSAYKSGAVVRCRKGDIWKGIKEVKDDPQSGKSSPYGSGFTKVKEELILEKAKETLRTWFKRKGAPGKTGGWVDCNSPIRKDGEITGYKSCGRQKDEKRSKYPSCRPTASQCNDPGKGKTWGKTK
jgi:hypothetical protein